MDASEPSRSFVEATPTHGTYPAAPVIETDRLILRGHRLEDLSDCVNMWSDPAVTRFIGGKPSSPQQSWARLLGYVGHWSVLHFGYWVIEEKATHSFIGEIGFADFKREVVPSLRNLPELGFAIIPRAQEKGLTTEAARAVVAWGDDRFAAPRTFCLINPENVASLRIVTKLGYEVFERATFNERLTLFLARTRPPK